MSSVLPFEAIHKRQQLLQILPTSEDILFPIHTHTHTHTHTNEDILFPIHTHTHTHTHTPKNATARNFSRKDPIPLPPKTTPPKPRAHSYGIASGRLSKTIRTWTWHSSSTGYRRCRCAQKIQQTREKSSFTVVLLYCLSQFKPSVGPSKASKCHLALRGVEEATPTLRRRPELNQSDLRCLLYSYFSLPSWHIAEPLPAGKLVVVFRVCLCPYERKWSANNHLECSQLHYNTLRAPCLLYDGGHRSLQP